MGRRVRNIRRFRQVASILAKHGLGFLLEERGRRLSQQADARPTGEQLAVRIRQVLEELGPTYIKLGQIASTRADLFPPELIRELERLQDDVPPFAVQEVFRILEKEWGVQPEEVLQEFEEQSLAAASLGQVHRARLKTGEEVAIKVQRPDIERIVEDDLQLLYDLVPLIERRVKFSRLYPLREVVDELADSLRRELNYLLEARNAERIQAGLSVGDKVRVPRVHWAYTTRRVLVMEYVDGIRVGDGQALREAGVDTRQLAERLTTTILKQILLEGVFHADPHPGNLMVDREGHLVLLDFGMVGELSPSMRDSFSRLVVGFFRKSSPAILRALDAMGVVPADADYEALEKDVDRLREKYYDIPLHEVNLGEVVRDLLEVTFRHQILVPKELTMVGRALVILEGVVAELEPGFRVADAAESFGYLLLRRQWKGWLEWGKRLDEAADAWDSLRHTPRLLYRLLVRISGGKWSIPLHLKDASELLRRLERTVNRITFSLVLLSFSILMAALVLASAMGGPDYAIWKFPVAEIGFFVAGIMFLLILWSIFRSGRF